MVGEERWFILISLFCGIGYNTPGVSVPCVSEMRFALSTPLFFFLYDSAPFFVFYPRHGGGKGDRGGRVGFVETRWPCYPPVTTDGNIVT